MLLAIDSRFELLVLFICLKHFQIHVRILSGTNGSRPGHGLRLNQLGGLCNSAAFSWNLENSIDRFRLSKVGRSALVNSLWSTSRFLRRISIFGATMLLVQLVLVERLGSGWITSSTCASLWRGWITCSLSSAVGSSAWCRDFRCQPHGVEDGLPARVVPVLFPEFGQLLGTIMLALTSLSQVII